MPFVPVILCGGSGTRLWPLSRSHLPKQFLPLVSERTMLQETVARLQGLEDASARSRSRTTSIASSPPSSCARFRVAPQALILEPAGRGTAAAAAAAALAVAARQGARAARPAGGPRDLATCRVPCRDREGHALPAKGARRVRHCADEPPHRLRLHQAGNAARRRVHRRALRREARSRDREGLSSHPAAISGTAACSCSVPTATSRAERHGPDRSSPR